MRLNRRSFVLGASVSLAGASAARIGQLSFSAQAQSVSRDVLVVLFLRGGCDGLSVVAPCDDPNYIAKRPTLKLIGSGTGTDVALPLANSLNDALNFRLHPRAVDLKALYDAGKLAIVHATGLLDGTRSHFDAQAFMERGTTAGSTSSGWLARYLASIGATGSSTTLPAVAASSTAPISLLGSADAASMTDPNSFSFNGTNWRYKDLQYAALKALYTGTEPIQQAGTGTIQMIDRIQAKLPRGTNGSVLPYTPDADAVYPSSSLSTALKTIAQLIKLEIGLQVATLDFGGWDTHQNQGNTTGGFNTQIDVLSKALAAFYNDLNTSSKNYMASTTLVLMSEFGRRLKENASAGTDHGHGNVMFVLGDNVNGGRMYGRWPGLSDDVLDNQVDLAITTDYRTVLAEVLIRRTANPNLGAVFPDLTKYEPLGVVAGADLPPVLGTQPGSGSSRLFVPFVSN